MSELTRIPARTGRFVAWDGARGRPCWRSPSRAAPPRATADDRLPAASAVRVARLVRPQSLLEGEAFAVVAG